MNDESSSDAQEVLRRVRSSADPLPRDEARVLERVEQRLGLLSGLEAFQRAPARGVAPRGRPGTRIGSAPLRGSARALGSLPRLGLWAAMGVSMAGVGYGVAKRMHREQPMPPATVEQPVRPTPAAALVPASRLPASAVPASGVPASRLPALPPTAPVSAAAPPGASEALARSRQRQSPPRAEARASARADTKAAPLAQEASAAPAVGLREALALLERAQAAVRLGTAGDALDWLDRLEQRNPGALLEQERLVTRTLALCALGELSKARDLRARLERLDPQTIYRGQLDASCAKKE